MKKKIIRDIYFNGANDRNLMEFTGKFLGSGLIWVYIAISPEREWDKVYKKLPQHKKKSFRNEYNKAFLFCNIYKELSKLYIGKKFELKNLFLPQDAETGPEEFVKFEKSDELRWKEVLELAA